MCESSKSLDIMRKKEEPFLAPVHHMDYKAFSCFLLVAYMFSVYIDALVQHNVFLLPFPSFFPSSVEDLIAALFLPSDLRSSNTAVSSSLTSHELFHDGNTNIYFTHDKSCGNTVHKFVRGKGKGKAGW